MEGRAAAGLESAETLDGAVNFGLIEVEIQ